MPDLEKLIEFWRSILADKNSGLPATILDYIVLTVASLEELKKLKKGE